MNNHDDMTEHDDQLTRAQLIGMLLLGLCVWAFFIGVVYAVLKDSFAGLVISVTGIIGGYIIHRWLIYINHPKE
jgi:hypothetical protein